MDQCFSLSLSPPPLPLCLPSPLSKMNKHVLRRQSFIIHFLPLQKSSPHTSGTWWQEGAFCILTGQGFAKLLPSSASWRERRPGQKERAMGGRPFLGCPLRRLEHIPEPQAFVNKCFMSENENVVALQAHSFRAPGVTNHPHKWAIFRHLLAFIFQLHPIFNCLPVAF